ncbi:MAG: hypothetical protein Q7R83_03915 [bacterium]|nr:hypothetical protein [bacterium]
MDKPSQPLGHSVRIAAAVAIHDRVNQFIAAKVGERLLDATRVSEGRHGRLTCDLTTLPYPHVELVRILQRWQEARMEYGFSFGRSQRGTTRIDYFIVAVGVTQYEHAEPFARCGEHVVAVAYDAVWSTWEFVAEDGYEESRRARKLVSSLESGPITEEQAMAFIDRAVVYLCSAREVACAA